LDELTMMDFSALMLGRRWKFSRLRCPTGNATSERPPHERQSEHLHGGHVLVEKYGVDAAIKAATYADEFLEEGNATMAGVWQAFVAGVDELQRRRRPKN
jgi:hypothetical protein